MAKAKRIAVGGLMGRDAAHAMTFFAVTALLCAAVMGLSRVIDPALAAVAVATAVAAVLGLVVWLVGRRKEP